MKKTLIASLIAISTFTANAEVLLNDVEPKENDIIIGEVVSALSGGNLNSGMEVKNIKQLNNSDNYFVKIKEYNQEYTMLFVRELGSFVIGGTGDFYDAETGNMVNKGYDASIVKPRLQNEIDESHYMNFPSDKENADTLIVFTDPTCGYCTKLHNEISDFHKEGISIKYLPFPRGGKNGPGYDLLAHSYCSTDRKAAFEYSKSHSNEGIPQDQVTYTPEEFEKCKEIVDRYYNLGNTLGITGTPAIFDENGYQIGGYMPARSAKSAIKKNK